MSRVRIPPVLRDVVGGSRELSASGSTVAEVLDDLFASQPALGDRLTAGTGTISSFVNVFVNGEDVRHHQGLDTRVGADDVVILLPAMAGGAYGPPAGGSRLTEHRGRDVGAQRRRRADAGSARGRLRQSQQRRQVTLALN